MRILDYMKLALLLVVIMGACVDSTTPPTSPVPDESEVIQVGYVDCDAGAPDSGSWGSAAGPAAMDDRK
jgi:hypothetical protein